MIRKQCNFPGCIRMGRNKGSFKGVRKWDHFCEFHHRIKNTLNPRGYLEKPKIDNSKCVICGWDKAPCDRHRIDPNLGYTKENIRSLCPNCHRLVSLNLLKI